MNRYTFVHPSSPPLAKVLREQFTLVHFPCGQSLLPVFVPQSPSAVLNRPSAEVFASKPSAGVSNMFTFVHPSFCPWLRSSANFRPCPFASPLMHFSEHFIIAAFIRTVTSRLLFGLFQLLGHFRSYRLGTVAFYMVVLRLYFRRTRIISCCQP